MLKRLCYPLPVHADLNTRLSLDSIKAECSTSRATTKDSCIGCHCHAIVDTIEGFHVHPVVAIARTTESYLVHPIVMPPKAVIDAGEATGSPATPSTEGTHTIVTGLSAVATYPFPYKGSCAAAASRTCQGFRSSAPYLCLSRILVFHKGFIGKSLKALTAQHRVCAFLASSSQRSFFCYWC